MEKEKVNNLLLRTEMMKEGIKQYELAKLMNVSVNTLVRRMREEMPKEEQKRLIELFKNNRKDI